MTFGVLYVAGAGQSNIVVCDGCKCRIDEEEFSESVAVHKTPLKLAEGDYFAYMWTLHGTCLRRFIDLHNSPRGKWYSVPIAEVQNVAVTWWQEIDMERLYAQDEGAV